MKLLLLLSLLQQTPTQKAPPPDTVKVKQMSEVIVRAQKPVYQQGPYGTIVNVQNDLLSAGSSALETLERSPGIQVDHRYNTITLNGKAGVIVLINGRRSHLSADQLMTLLNSLNADDIEKIEIMTTPPANFDAEGSAGIVNIVLRKDRHRGNHGSLALSGGYGQGAKSSGSLRVEHNTGKIDVSAAYSFSHDHSAAQLLANGTEILPQWAGQTTFDYQSLGQSIYNSQAARAGLDAHLDSQTTVGTTFSYWYSRSNYNAQNQEDYLFPDSAFHFKGNVVSTSTWKSPSASLTLERKLRKGEKLNLDLYYDVNLVGGGSSVQSAFLDQHGEPVDPGDTAFAPRQEGFSSATLKTGTVQMDYTREWNARLTLEAGVKGDYSRNLSSGGIESLVNGVWVDRGDITSELLVRENIDAAYASFHIHLDTATTLIAGVRYEYSHTLGTDNQTDTLDRKLSGLFPDVFITRKLGDHQTLEAAYTKRISRPSYDDLSNSIGYNDPLSVFTGNPFLRPTISHTLKAGYTNRGYALSLLVSRDEYPIARYQVVSQPGSDLIYIMPENLDYQNALTLQAVLPWKVTSWWDINTSFSGGWTQYKATFDPSPYQKTFPSCNINVTGVFKLPHHITVEAYGNYTTRTYYAANMNYANAALSLGFKKALGASSNLLLSISDVCRMQYLNTLGQVTQDAFDSKVWVSYRPESWVRPIVKVSYTRTFGASSK